MLLTLAEPVAATANPVGSTPAPPPASTLLQLLFGKHISYSLSAVARLGVADYMGADWILVDELANKVTAHCPSLYRVMRALAGLGVFEETSGKCFRLTSVGELLKTEAPGSMRYFAIQLGDPWSTASWEHFPQTLRTGQDSVSLTYGKNVFDFFAEQPDQAETFHRSMTGLSAGMTDAIVSAYDFSCICRLADVGGGHGMLLASVLDRYPAMQGVVFDLPEVVSGALSQPHCRRSAYRMQVESGSFFERVPAGCDAYMMKFILHDWSDDHCRKILSCIRQQLPADGRVLICEQVVSNDSAISPAKLLDLEMLAMTVGGRERTVNEFATLLTSVGLRLTRVFPTASLVCILEARLR